MYDLRTENIGIKPGNAIKNDSMATAGRAGNKVLLPERKGGAG